MFKPHIGDCVECPRTNTIIPVKSGLCQYCNHEKKQRNKSIPTSKGTSESADGGEVSNFEEGTQYDRNGVLSGIRESSTGSSNTNIGHGFNYSTRKFNVKRSTEKVSIGYVAGLDQEKNNPHKSGRSSGEMGKKTKPSFFKARKPILKSKKGTGEAEIFAEIAEEREWICFVSSISLKELTATQFMHVLPKALNKYPLFKLYKKNIQLASDEIHYAWDFWPESKLRADRRFDKLFALQEELIQEYKLLKTKP